MNNIWNTLVHLKQNVQSSLINDNLLINRLPDWQKVQVMFWGRETHKSLLKRWRTKLVVFVGQGRRNADQGDTNVIHRQQNKQNCTFPRLLLRSCFGKSENDRVRFRIPLGATLCDVIQRSLASHPLGPLGIPSTAPLQFFTRPVLLRTLMVKVASVAS